MNNPFVTASEIGEYVYCRRSWWLRFKGITKSSTPEMAEGIKYHDDLYKDLGTKNAIKRAAFILIGLGVFTAIILAILAALIL